MDGAARKRTVRTWHLSKDGRRGRARHWHIWQKSALQDWRQLAQRPRVGTVPGVMEKQQVASVTQPSEPS